MNQSPAKRAALGALLAFSSAETHAQIGQPHERGTVGPHLSRPVARSEARSVIHEGFTSIQVNLDEFGQNVLGDAANEPSLAVDPTALNRIVVGWRQFDSIASNFRQAGYSTSNDGGRTWAPMGILEPGVFRSDPVLRAGPDGTIYYLSLRTDLRDDWSTTLFVSHDAGETWPESLPALGGDKAWLEVDRTDGPGSGQLYQVWNPFSSNSEPNDFSRSLDEGLTWDEPIRMHRFAKGFGSLAADRNGRLYVAGTDGGSSRIAALRSDDAWDPSVDEPRFTQSIVSPFGYRLSGTPNPGGLLQQVEVSVDNSFGQNAGNVYVLFTTAGIMPDSRDRTDLMLYRSVDGGESWLDPIRVNDDSQAQPHWRWFGTMDVAPNGRIDIVWNDTRDAPSDEPNLSRTYYAYSTDGGQSFSVNTPLGPQWDSHVGWPDQRKIGDYYDIHSDDVGAHLIYATTYNSEQDVYYLRIGDYDCNANGIGDSIDIADGTAEDCNANGIPDSCEIATGAEADEDGNGVPDRCECVADLDRDLDIDSDDFFLFLDFFAAGDSRADLDGDGDIDADDLSAYFDVFASSCP